MVSGSDVKITWLGHATTIIETPDGKIVLIDPWLEQNPAVPEDMKTIEHVDLILITHAHFDHMADAVSVAQRTGADVIAIADFCEYLASKGIENCTGMNKGGTVNWNGTRVTMVDAIHSSGFSDGDHFISGGDPAGFVIRFSNGFTVYHSGDTDVFESMSLIGRLHHPDVALLCIGDHYTMGPRGAAEAIRLLGLKRIIPIHWGTFPLLTGTPEQLQQEGKDIPGLKVTALKPGQTVTQTELV